MKALCWNGKNDIRCETVPDPKIEDARDVIVKVSCCAICGSDLHLMDGLMPTMKSGDILGHELWHCGEWRFKPALAPVTKP